MKERPIIFNAEIVRAILADRCTQTRRVIKPQPPWWVEKASGWAITVDGEWYTEIGPAVWTMKSQYGQLGDQLWVREIWATIKLYNDLSPSEIPIYDRLPALYYSEWPGAARDSANRGRWRSPIHMIRWASRITLEITDIMVERLQKISSEDIIAGGLSTNLREFDAFVHLNTQFIELWDSINKKRGFGWDQNPWVWAISFRRIKQ